MSDKTLRKQVEAIKRQKIVSKKVVSLDEFRGITKKTEPKSVLVVDDDEVMRNALNRILESEGFKVIQAKDGLELSKVLEDTSFDLILLDINLPWVDGFELCRLVKSQKHLVHVPVILVSARKSEADIKCGMDAGADDYVTKPFDVDYILSVINKTVLKSS